MFHAGVIAAFYNGMTPEAGVALAHGNTPATHVGTRAGPTPTCPIPEARLGCCVNDIIIGAKKEVFSSR